MPGKNPSEAFHNFYRPLQQDVSCLTNDILVVSAGGRHDVDKTHALTLAGDAILLNADGLQLNVELQYQIIRTGNRGKDAYRCTTRAYAYAILDDGNHGIYAWHWHPFGKSSYVEPHAHPHAIDPRLLSPRTHLPTGRISLEQVIRLAIDQLGAEPNRADWDKVLAMNDAKFQLHRSWRDPQEAPRPDPATP